MVEVADMSREPIPLMEVQIGGVKKVGDEALGWQVAVAVLGEWVEGQTCTMGIALICPPTVLHVSLHTACLTDTACWRAFGRLLRFTDTPIVIPKLWE